MPKIDIKGHGRTMSRQDSSVSDVILSLQTRLNRLEALVLTLGYAPDDHGQWVLQEPPVQRLSYVDAEHVRLWPDA